MCCSEFIRWGSGCVAAASLVFSTSAATYTLQDLGEMVDLPSRDESGPNGINANGTIAASIVTNGAYRAVLFNTGWTNLGTLGGNESLGSDVNDAGAAVGVSLTSGGSTRAFLWTPGGTDGVPSNPQMRDLGTLGGVNSEAYAINGSGQISGYAQTAEQDHAFIYSQGAMVDIGVLLGNSLPHSYGLSINDSGHVAGLAYNNGFSTPHAFFYNGVTAVDIGTLGGGSASALAINNSDRIAGYSTTTNGFDHAFLYSNGNKTDLGTLGGNYSYAIGLNNSNVVVGGSFVDPADTIYHAFVTVNGAMQDLNELLDASGSGWTLVEARAINDAGQIVGLGRVGGTTRGFLLNPIPTISGPTLTNIRIRNADVLISFTSEAGAAYVLQASTNLVNGSWENVLAGIPGTGSIMTVTNSGGAALTQKYYRLEASAP
jgi:probable HAF family extracellular repeat protein